MFNSPLRYPGGKNKLTAFFAKLCVDNGVNGHYVEPYSGGASVALFLLMEGIVKKVTINDMDRSIYAFWHSVLNDTEQLCDLIENTPINIENWKVQKEIQNRKETTTLLELGFSTLFLNRTNRSGIINGGVIGGINQEGKYKIDCRFNKDDIIKRIKAISRHKDNIQLLQMDAIHLIDLVESYPEQNNVIFYFDPPYYLKANSLYMNHYKNDSHSAVSERIRNIRNIRWVVSYDNVPQIQDLYSDFSKKEYSFKHTAGVTKIGKELLFFSHNLVQPNIEDWNPLKFKIRKITDNTKLRIGYKGLRTNFTLVPRLLKTEQISLFVH